jgi:hypothetical protein
MITQIRQIEQPFPFLEIKNLYNDEELKLIWQELEFLNCLNKLESPEKTGTALDEKKKVPLKKNVGLFLDNIYTKRNISNILTVNPKLFSEQIVNAFVELSFAYEFIKKTNNDKTLISYYENGGYYKPHEDKSLFTAVTWFFKEPKAFTGGDLYFTDYNIQVEIENNMSVIFPSFVKHAVDKIILKNKNLVGYGRYAMTQFLYSSVEE